MAVNGVTLGCPIQPRQLGRPQICEALHCRNEQFPPDAETVRHDFPSDLSSRRIVSVMSNLNSVGTLITVFGVTASGRSGESGISQSWVARVTSLRTPPE